MNSLKDTLAAHPFPFTLHSFQQEDLNTTYAGAWDKVALFYEVGLGKTATSTALALMYGAQHNIITMPPVLLAQWSAWLKSVGSCGNQLVYEGSRNWRYSQKLEEHKWILMSQGIFRNDYSRIVQSLGHKDLTIISDEAQSLKSPTSALYKNTRDLSQGQNLILLTGTPLAKPADAYSYIKLKTPSIYRNKKHFDNVHIDEVDFFGQVVSYKNLDMLSKNLAFKAFKRGRECLSGQVDAVYTPIRYRMTKKHKALYDQLAEQQLLLLDDGSKIDATTASGLYHKLQQIVCNYGFFSGEEDEATIFDLVDEVAEEINLADHKSSKLIVWTWYKLTSRSMLKHLEKYGAVGAFSGVDSTKACKTFINDPNCRVIVAQPGSLGAGTDGMQVVCSECIYVETPPLLHFKQSAGRIARQGQKVPPNIRIAIAEGTLQVALHKRLLQNSELVAQVQGDVASLRKEIYGN